MNAVTTFPPVTETDEEKEKARLVKERECVLRMMQVSDEETFRLEFTFTVDPGEEERFDTTEMPLKSIDSNTLVDSFTTIVGDDEDGMR